MFLRRRPKELLSYAFVGILIYLIYEKLRSQDGKQVAEILASESFSGNILSKPAGLEKLFLLETPKCYLPDLQPNDPSLRGLVKPPVYLKCKKYKRYTYDSGTVIYVGWNVVNESFKGRFSHCRLTPITRPVSANSSHDSLGYLSPGPKFNVSVDVASLNHDHFHARCFDHQEKLLFENYHTIIIRKKDVEDRCKVKMQERAKDEPDIKETLNVYVLVVDSVSRLNTIRYMKTTRNFLLNDLNAVDMSGFNKVGERTYENVIPLVTGRTVKEFGWDAAKPSVFDSYRFIWSDYADKGYRTYYAEDFPYGATFDYDKPGFRKSPTDYFNRHLFLSMYKQPTKIVYNEENCILHKTQTDWVIDNAHKFATKFKSDPFFSYVQLTRITHDYIERTPTADVIYYEYLKRLYSNGVMNNTVLFFMADHGIRFGSILNSYVGLMEDRLPMLYVVLPKWFSEKYPDKMKNLKINSHRLTTHFDVYETFQELLHFTGKDRKDGGLSQAGQKRGYSLFSEVPFSRSCEEAGIPPQFCACSTLEKIDNINNDVHAATEFLVKHMNHQLKKVMHMCQPLTMDSVFDAYEVKPSSRVFVPLLTAHQITFTVKPGGGMFKAFVVFDVKKKFYKLGNAIQIIKTSEGPKKCSVEEELKSFCYCK